MSDQEVPRPEADDGTRVLAPKDPVDTRALLPHAGPAKPAQLPAFIGAYRILRVLGMGGMGVVYEAEQLSPHRHVALKVMRNPHLATDTQAQLWKREVETLGRLKHPNVATIFESGQTADGLDFYAMEMVQGETLDAWLAKRPGPLTSKEQKLRLRMFQVICEAVHYAHLRGVIHRDLKPANIMVLDERDPATGTSAAGGPLLKILDFGLARFVDPDTQAASLRTEVGVIMGTLQYMSPEQARGDSLAIDLRTDVYALGVILYEMMAGQRPYDLGKSALSEMVRIICEEPPTRLQLTLKGSRDADLGTIVGKSLEKEPDRRYASVGALAEDVERFLSSQPIVARPQSRAYRTRMFVRRHGLGVGVGASVLVMLSAFTVAMAIQSRRIAHEALVSRRVTEFMTQMFRVSDPSEARGNAITAREILDKAAANIGAGLNQDPEIQARLMRTMGMVYQSLGLYAQAQGLLERSVAIQRRHFGVKRAETLAAMGDLAMVYVYEGRLKDSEALFLEALPLLRHLKGARHPDTLLMTKNLVAQYVDQGRYPEAERLGLEVTRTLREVLGPDHPETLKAVVTLANVYHYQGRFPEAERLLEDGVQRPSRVLGADHPATLDSRNNLAAILVDEKRYPEAERMNDEIIASKRRMLGPEHPETLAAMNNLAIVYYLEGQYQASEGLNLELLALERKVLGPRHPDLGNTLYCLACLKVRSGDLDQAILRLQEALQATLPVAGAQGLASDPDLEPLHADPRFKAMVSEVERTYGVPKPKKLSKRN